MKLDPWRRYTPPPIQKMLNRAAITSFALSGRRGRYAFAPLSIVSIKKIYIFFLGGGRYAAKGLISRDIAQQKFSINYNV